MITLEQETPTRQEVEIYSDRLVGACELLRHIDSGDLPISHYSSGEHKQVRAKNGGMVETDQFEMLPIKPEGKVKGLRFAVAYTIFEAREMFREWGAVEEADKIIEENRL